MTSASAPGKVILFGEHAVVYGRPALAVPVAQVRAEAMVGRGSPGSGLWLEAINLGERFRAVDRPDHPLAAMVREVLHRIPLDATLPQPDLVITIRSSIPIARGLGSGAAISTAMGRALSAHLGRPLPVAELSAAVYEVEKLYHGTPSGIDNTVIVYEQPVYFIRRSEGNVIQPFATTAPFSLLIADTGIGSPTRTTVGDVRRGWLADPRRYEAIFDQIGEIAEMARRAMETGRVADLGGLMDANQEWLRQLGVSSPELERLIDTAKAAGAVGAKLSGGGRGGNMIALVEPAGRADLDRALGRVEEALVQAGARGVLRVTVG